MGGQEGQRQFQRTFTIEPQQGFEHAQLTLQLQAVAGLGLGGGRAILQHLQQARAGLGDQLLQGGGTRGTHGGEDAAARGQDFHVALTLQAQLELRSPVADPDGVGVRVDKAWHDHTTASIQPWLVRVALQQVCR